MILAEKILKNIQDFSISNHRSYKSKITKFDGKIVECDSFPLLLALCANYIVTMEVL